MQNIKKFPEEHRDILYFQGETGLRVSEVCALQIRDCNIPSSMILIQRTYSGYELIETTKGNRKDWIPLSKLALKIASKHVRNRFGYDFLFINISRQRI
jgi:integrase